MRGFGVVREVAGSLVERALAGWLVEQPAPLRRVPVALLSREQARKAMEAAYEAELVLGLVDDSPDDDDPPPGTPGARSWKPDPELPGVSEFFTAELAVVLNCGRLSAGQRAHRASTYRTHLPATHLRELLEQLDALGVRAPQGGSVTLAVTEEDGTLRATSTLEQLRRIARRGCPDHPSEDCGCAVLDRPEPVDRYAPSAAQQRFVRTRDRSCRLPTCGQRVGWADVDPVVPHACGGATDCADLCCLCRSHHRMKTLVRGWRFQMSPDGVLTVTTPSGITRTTPPPGTRPPPPAPDPPPGTAGRDEPPPS
ncbi:hypothetical protein JD79_03264 [Geodermatophilus normandii]|uniref:HNH endonuclease n=1 Tax=Geodermatophilus normandii TaxID=1137989 RepID=A0A317QMW5_9ACTN|nr:HNH endonuclease signature motif containing protein [Geodermatophilus normandii]PWW24086.1 hypothetical protein JD79_03264 [Geodermatophilus normandii]